VQRCRWMNALPLHRGVLVKTNTSFGRVCTSGVRACWPLSGAATYPAGARPSKCILFYFILTRAFPGLSRSHALRVCLNKMWHLVSPCAVKVECRPIYTSLHPREGTSRRRTGACRAVGLPFPTIPRRSCVGLPPCIWLWSMPCRTMTGHGRLGGRVQTHPVDPIATLES
jgi:hypothetical protein